MALGFLVGASDVPQSRRAGRKARCPAMQMNLSDDWREFRAKLVSQEGGRVGGSGRFWAHETELLEPGTCLFSTANQDWGESMEHRNKSVILIVKASKTDYSGIILNRCTGKTVQELHSLQARVGKEFSKNQVFFGGDYSLGAVDIVHGIPPQRCPGAEELVPGLYRGGFNASRELVQDSIVEPGCFRIFLGYTHWKAEQLHKEVRRKVWHPVCCSAGLLHKTGQRDIWYDVLSLVGLPTITTQ